MKVKAGVIAGLTGLAVVGGAALAPEGRAAVDGAGVATLGPPSLVTVPCSPFRPLIGWPYCGGASPGHTVSYTDVGVTNNNMTVKISVNEKLNIVDPGVAIVGACSGVGEVTCDITDQDLHIAAGLGDDVIRLRQSTTVAYVDCGPGYDKLFKGNARASSIGCEEVA